jgi:hypothetical protein
LLQLRNSETKAGARLIWEKGARAGWIYSRVWATSAVTMITSAGPSWRSAMAPSTSLPESLPRSTTAVGQSNPWWRGRTEEGGADDWTWPEGGMATWQPELVPSTAAALSGAKRSSRGDACRPITSTPAQIAAQIGRRRWNFLPRRSDPYLLPMHCTMVLVLQSSDSQDLGQIYSGFSMATSGSANDKVVVW